MLKPKSPQELPLYYTDFDGIQPYTSQYKSLDENEFFDDLYYPYPLSISRDTPYEITNVYGEKTILETGK